MTLWTHIGVADGVQGIMEVDCMDGWVVGEWEVGEEGQWADER